MATGFFLAAVLLGAAAPDETVFVAGRMHVQAGAERTRSRRFEFTLSKRRGRVLKGHACVFADLDRDGGWEGSCFNLQPHMVEKLVGGEAFTRELTHVDRAAQRLMRLLVSEGNPHLPEGMHLVGYDPRVDLEVATEKFVEGDL